MRSVWRGDASLAKTYWLWFVVPSAVLRGAFIVFNETTTQMSVTEPTKYEILRWCVNGSAFAVVCFGAIAVLRASFNKTRRPTPGLWGYVASFFAVIAIFRTAADMLGIIPPTESEIRQEFAKIDFGLPKKVDDFTTLQSIIYDTGRVLAYRFDVADNFPPPLNTDRIKTKTLPTICETWKQAFENGEIYAVEYRYQYLGKRQVFRVVKSECP